MKSFGKTKITSIPLLFFSFFVLLISITQCLPLTIHGCHEEEIKALLNFKSSLEDPSNRLSSWHESNQHQNCCSWHGIQCSYESSHVISVNLRNIKLETHQYEYELGNEYFRQDVPPPNTKLRGKLSPSLFKLTHLEYLDLGFNDFSESNIPNEFSYLTKLAHLDLSNSNFSASISTQFSNLSHLQYLDLSCNFLSKNGVLFSATTCLRSSSTKWIKGLVNLKVLRLSGFDLYEAGYKENLAEPILYLSNLRDLDISFSMIPFFSVHGKFYNLSRLFFLRMNYNFMNSPIPVQFANLTSLSILELSQCGLLGSVPYLPQLETLDVSSNSFLGFNLHRMFENHWPKLQILDISFNVLPKSIPNSISNAPMLVSLSASACSIQGSLPPSIYNLSRLQYLDLSDNNITSHIHSSISNLRNLNFLDLSGNNFHGSIPNSICEIDSLRHLVLESNNISGILPSCITVLTNLVDFRISKNSIEVNVSLISLINKFHLSTLDLTSNRLTLDTNEHLHLDPKPKLEVLALGSCNLKLFPTFICNLTQLKALNLSHNNLTGVVPSCIFKLENLIYLDLSNNKLCGHLPLPPQGVHHFDLSHNKLSGEISLEIGQGLSSSSYIGLNDNQLSGSIPSSICSQQVPAFIDLSNNKLSGTIHSTIGYCTSLFNLNLGNNNLTGNVPNELEQAKNLIYLQLNDNNLDGGFPKSIKKLMHLEVLSLGNNSFEGVIPTGLGSLNFLRILSLKSNKFEGSIPEDISHLYELQILDLSINNLSGPIPSNIGKLRKLASTPSSSGNSTTLQFQLVTKGTMRQFEYLYDYISGIDLSCNILDGNIPKEIGLLKGLVMLNLSHNRFSSNIPASVGNMSGLESLDLSSNRLDGHIPQSLTLIDSLGFFNLSYNNLSGKVPEGIHFDTLGLDGSAFAGNDLLCGYPTGKDCEGDHDTNNNDPSKKGEEKDQDDVKEKLLLYAIVSLGFVVGFWGLFVVLLVNKQRWWFPYWKFINTVAVGIVECIQN